MPDLEKVIKGLEGVYRCVSPVNHTCGDCPYQDNHVECIRRALSDAIALLKEQNQDEKRFTAYEVCMALIYHGQSDERFEWGEVIKYSPSEVEKILKGEM